ncbi:KxDL motif-containing protein, partial [Homarus americanus]
MAASSPDSDLGSIDCFQNYTAPEVFVQGLAGQINQQDVEAIVRAQKQMLHELHYHDPGYITHQMTEATLPPPTPDDLGLHYHLHQMTEDDWLHYHHQHQMTGYITTNTR